MKPKNLIFVFLIGIGFLLPILNAEASIVNYYTTGDHFQQDTSSFTSSGTGYVSYTTSSNNYLKIKAKASSYWDIFGPKGGTVFVDLYYHVTISHSDTYDFETQWVFNGEIFDDDANECFTQLKIQYYLESYSHTITYGGNGYYVKSWSAQSITLTHKDNIVLSPAEYTVNIKITLDAHGATPYSGTDKVDFKDFASNNGYLRLDKVFFRDQTS